MYIQQMLIYLTACQMLGKEEEWRMNSAELTVSRENRQHSDKGTRVIKEPIPLLPSESNATPGNADLWLKCKWNNHRWLWLGIKHWTNGGLKTKANTLYVTKCLLHLKSWQKYTSIEWKHQEKCYFYSNLLENSLKKNNSFA